MQPLEESSLGETEAPTRLEDFGPTPAPSAAVPATPAEEGSAASEDESLLAKIGPKTAPNVAAAFRLIDDGRQKMNQHSYDNALDRLERAVAIDPTNPYGYYYLAQVHYQRKHYDQAIAFANRAAGLSARADRVFVGRIYALQGAVFEEVGRYPDARKAYEKAVRSDPNNLAARVGVARLGTGK